MKRSTKNRGRFNLSFVVSGIFAVSDASNVPQKISLQNKLNFQGAITVTISSVWIGVRTVNSVKNYSIDWKRTTVSLPWWQLARWPRRIIFLMNGRIMISLWLCKTGVRKVFDHTWNGCRRTIKSSLCSVKRSMALKYFTAMPICWSLPFLILKSCTWPALTVTGCWSIAQTCRRIWIRLWSKRKRQRACKRTTYGASGNFLRVFL